jgi:hypothetical protein
VHYRKVGDKVIEQDAATLDWKATNANSVTIDPLGKESETGSSKVLAEPKQTAKGTVNEDITYKLTASNACGGTVTKTATLHVVGSIEPPPTATLASLFYPTAYPTRKHPNVGLVASEKATLANAATQFKNYLQYDPQGSLVVVGHADVRGSRKYNEALSERRAELAKKYLISKGVPGDKIQTEAKGKDQQLDMNEVKALQAKDDQKPEKWMAKHTRATWMAYNRRSDIVLKPQNIQSTLLYPNDVVAVRVLWQLPMPKLSQVMKLSNEPGTTVAEAHAGGSPK